MTPSMDQIVHEIIFVLKVVHSYMSAESVHPTSCKEIIIDTLRNVWMEVAARRDNYEKAAMLRSIYPIHHMFNNLFTSKSPLFHHYPS
jgi:hypothetical protein